jgi:colicin import membrane protein
VESAARAGEETRVLARQAEEAGASSARAIHEALDKADFAARHAALAGKEEAVQAAQATREALQKAREAARLAADAARAAAGATKP